MDKELHLRESAYDREEEGEGSLSLTDRALVFAAYRHSGQKRKGSGIPYVTHVVEVMAIVAGITEDEEVRAAALLHDTLEDTETTKEELVRRFGQRVADLVAAESEDKREDRPAADTWEIRKKETLEHLRRAGAEVRIIALGDKLSNIRSMVRDHRAVGESLWERFNQKDSQMHGWYYKSIADILGGDGSIRETAAFREYTGLCTELFG